MFVLWRRESQGEPENVSGCRNLTRRNPFKQNNKACMAVLPVWKNSLQYIKILKGNIDYEFVDELHHTFLKSLVVIMICGLPPSNSRA